MGMLASSVSGTGSAGVSAAAIVVAGDNGIQAGVKKEVFATREDLNDRLARYDKVVEFNTTRQQDQAIRKAANNIGINFGAYNLITNNCSQYASLVLSYGGIKTTQNPIPNIAHNYILQNNVSPFMRVIR